MLQSGAFGFDDEVRNPTIKILAQYDVLPC